MGVRSVPQRETTRSNAKAHGSRRPRRSKILVFACPKNTRRQEQLYHGVHSISTHYHGVPGGGVSALLCSARRRRALIHRSIIGGVRCGGEGGSESTRHKARVHVGAKRFRGTATNSARRQQAARYDTRWCQKLTRYKFSVINRAQNCPRIREIPRYRHK